MSYDRPLRHSFNLLSDYIREGNEKVFINGSFICNYMTQTVESTSEGTVT